MTVKKESLFFLEMNFCKQPLVITIIIRCFYSATNRFLRFHSKEVHVWVCTWHPDVFVKSKSILLYWGWSFNYTWIKSDNILPYSQPGFQESYFKWCRLRHVNFQETHEPWETIFSLVRHTYKAIISNSRADRISI